MRIAWGRLLSAEALRKLVMYSASIGCDPSDLSACIYFESRWNPRATNPSSTAAGILQWIEANYRSYGLTREQLLALSVEDQLDLVARYFRPYNGRVSTLDDLYMAILRPTAIGLPADAVLFANKTQAYEANAGLDIDHDGQITKAECVTFVRRRLEEGLRPENVAEWEVPTQPAAPIEERPVEPEKGDTMGDTVNTVAGIASIFNPAAGALIGLAGNLFKAFQPALQQKLTKEIDRRVKDPTISGPAAAEIVGTLANMVVSQAKVQTGETDDFMAVAKAATTPEIKAAIETQVSATLDDYIKMGNAVSTWDNALWTAQNVGKQTVSSIAIAEHKAGIWDMTRTLVYTTCLVLVCLSIGLLVLIGKQAWGEPGKIDSGLIGLAGPIWMGTIASAFMAMIMYRFDGNKESTAQSQALVSAIDQRGATR